MSALTKGSLCSGYGGLDLATPGALRFVAEIDADANAVLAHEHPEVPNLRDISDIATRRWGHRDRVDLLTAGFPCQPVSAAGRQKAHADARWLWPAVLDAVECIRPGEVFLENVQNIVSIRGGAILAEILTGLHKARYECRWTVLGACAIGAPHHRHRWYLRGRRTRGRAPAAVRLVNRCGAPRKGGRALLPTPTRSDGAGGPFGHRDGGLNLRSAVQLLPTPTARDADSRGEGDERFWSARAERRSNGMPLGAALALMPERWGRFAQAVELWETITGRAAPAPTVLAPRGGQRLNPALSEWMMGLPAGMITGRVERSAALRLIGNGVVPAAAAAFAQLRAEGAQL